MRRLFKRESGFTLVELLVVVGIMVALAAAIIPNIARFTGSGQAAGGEAEFKAVQAAMDAAIADNGLTTVTAQTGVDDFNAAASSIDDGADDIAGNADDIYLYPTYLRVEMAGYGPYDWDATGLVTQP